MDCLERKMDNLHSELSLYKNKCNSLEEQNEGLLDQMKRLQAQLMGNPCATQPAVRTVTTSQTAAVGIVAIKK